jgi:glutaconyl-CoA/methylmalonyl-CoA decarboxylase subunit gamma
MQKKYKITVDGKEYNVTVEDISEGGSLLYPEPGSMNIPPPRAAAVTAPPEASAAAGGPAAAGDVLSTMGGVVDSVEVTVGQRVNAGDTVAIVEAMKMKTPMIAKVSGTVASIAVKAGDPVEPGRVLMTIS